VAERIYGLDQALTEGRVAQNPGAIMILQRAGHNLGRRSRVAVDQYDNRVALAKLAPAGQVRLFGVGPTFVGNDHLPSIEPASCHRDTLLEQAARVLAKVENQALDVLLSQRLQ